METPADQPFAEQRELSRILRNINLDMMGITLLGSDGIFRSFTASREVIDAVPLGPGLIKALLDCMPFEHETENRFRGVDGRDVPQAQWYRPAKSDVSEPLTKEEEEEGQRLFAEKGTRWWQEKQEEWKSQDDSTCQVTILSNHNLGTDQKENSEAQIIFDPCNPEIKRDILRSIPFSLSQPMLFRTFRQMAVSFSRGLGHTKWKLLWNPLA